MEKMTTAQWAIIISCLGLLVTLITVIVKLASTITELSTTMKLFAKSFDKMENDNKDDHNDIYEKLDAHGNRLSTLEEWKKEQKGAG